MSETSEARTHRLVRISDLLELDDRQFEAAIADLPEALRIARGIRAALREIAASMGLPDPAPDAAACVPHLDWIDDGERNITLNVSVATPTDRSESDGNE